MKKNKSQTRSLVAKTTGLLLALITVAAEAFTFSAEGGDGGYDLTAIRERFFTGAAANNQFGASVAAAGDVNGDGHSDLIVGAINRGRAYVFFGGANIDNVADVTLTGTIAGEFGSRVAGAGDVNGDGYSDVIVSEPQSAKAFIYFGGARMNNVVDVTLSGVAVADLFGSAVGGVGDVNGDGYGDVIVGAPSALGSGQAYIHYGGVSMDNVADVTFTGQASGDRFGSVAIGSGDFNGDGYSDVIVGASGHDAMGTDAGRAYVYFGGASMNNVADVVLERGTVDDQFGAAVAGAGDVNGDGYSDVVIGARMSDSVATNAGRAFVYFGGASMNDVADVVLNGAAASDQFGNTVAGGEDVNGDGYGDVMVGAHLNDAGGTNAGRVYIYFGGASMDNVADALFTGAAASDQFSGSIAGAGDVDNDGYDDVIIGAAFNDAGGTNAGRAYLYLNSLTGVDIADEVFKGEAGFNVFGSSVAGAGDVNGDGYSDLIVGAPGYSSETGRAYVYLGGPRLNNIVDVTLTGAAVGDRFGESVASAGDVNGDGFSDVIVGAPFNDFAGADAGRAYIYFGGATMNSGIDVTLTGAAAGDRFGSAVAGAGDVNGDGYSDVIIGAPFNASGKGRAYVYYGGASVNSTVDRTLSGAAAGDRFGASVAGAGDANGDGYGDIIVGAPLNDAGGTDAGRAYVIFDVYFGGDPITNVRDVIITGSAAGVQLDNTVAGAGDVNGDGYADILAGGDLYFGGPVMDNVLDVDLNSGEAGAGTSMPMATAMS